MSESDWLRAAGEQAAARRFQEILGGDFAESDDRRRDLGRWDKALGYASTIYAGTGGHTFRAAAFLQTAWAIYEALGNVPVRAPLPMRATGNAAEALRMAEEPIRCASCGSDPHMIGCPNDPGHGGA